MYKLVIVGVICLTHGLNKMYCVPMKDDSKVKFNLPYGLCIHSYFRLLLQLNFESNRCRRVIAVANMTGLKIVIRFTYACSTHSLFLE